MAHIRVAGRKEECNVSEIDDIVVCVLLLAAKVATKSQSLSHHDLALDCGFR